MPDQSLTSETDAGTAPKRERPIRSAESDISTRLRGVIGDESVTAFSRKCGFAESTLRKYLDGAEPSVLRLQSIADAAGVTLQWLATGEEPKLRRDLVAALRAAERGAPADEAPALDMERLAQALQAVEEGLQDADVELEPIDKAEVVCAAYDLIGQLGATAQARALIGRIVKAGR
jgi:transcriptional regulator with XRE-family HTH domain